MIIDLTDRMKYIGASEAASVLGLSRWASPLEIWAYKTGEIIPDPSKNEMAKWWGIELENAVARRFVKVTGKKVCRVTEAYVHPQFPFIKAHIDRKVIGERSILQCKTATAFKAKEWEEEDEIPAEYIIQEVVELACSGYDKAYIAVAIGNHDFKIKEIERDKALENDIIGKLATFWDSFVIPKIMPSIVLAQDSEVLLRLFPRAIPETEISLPIESNQIILDIESLKLREKNIKEAIVSSQNKLKALIKENEYGNTGTYRVSWKNIHKDSYIVKAQDFRQLTIRKNKEIPNGKNERC